MDELLTIKPKQVQLLPYVPRPIKEVNYITDQELINNIGQTLFIDVELYPNYFEIGFKGWGKYLALELPFNPQKLSWIMHNYCTVGFNSIKYDLNVLWASFARQDLEWLKKISDALIIEQRWPKQAQIDFGFKVFPTQHVDIIEVCPLRGSLKLYGARLHSPRIQELPYSPHQNLSEEQKIIVKHYNFNDLDVTELAFNNLKEQLALRSNLSAQYNSDLMSKSDAQIAESVIGNELKAITGYWPKKPTLDGELTFNFKTPPNLFFQTSNLQNVLKRVEGIKFSIYGDTGRLERSEMNDIRVTIGNSVYRMGSGGLHSSEECRAIQSGKDYIIKDIDVESFYPAIVINQKLYPKHLGPAFTQVYSGIRDRRVDAKRNKRIAESENLKVTINGTFGKTGSPYSFLYAPEMTIQITVGGQLYLLMLIEMLKLNDIPIASANTDGIVALCPHDKTELLGQLIKQWENITDFKTEETIYESIYSRDVNAYLAVKKKEKGYEFKGKNDYYDPWRPQNAKDAYWRFQKNPTHQICVEAIEKLISEGTPPETTIKACQDITKFVCVKNVKGGAHKDGEYLGKVIRWYYAVDIVGTINYILSNNKVPESDGAKPCMDLPDVLPTDIDYQWYINKTREMLEDCGYLKKVRQIAFFS